jgi:nitrate reductase alpha subunit
MNDKNAVPQPNPDLCPRIRYVQSRAARVVNDYARAVSTEDRHAAIIEAADLAHLVTQVIVPLARDSREPAASQFADEYQRLADSLMVIARHADHLEENYPDDGGRLLLLDRIDEMSAKLERVINRRTARESCRKAAEIFVLSIEQKARTA